MLPMYLLAMIQILFETFPVSSSGHLQLLQTFFTNMYDNHTSYEYFLHILHLPTAGIIIFFFYNNWKPFLLYPMRLRSVITKIFFFVGITDGITTIIYFFLKKNPISLPLYIGFFITSIMLFSLIWCPTRVYRKKMNWFDALVLGIVQGCALLPGISRFATTFVTACWLGLTPAKSFLIVWMMQLPLIIGASIRTILHYGTLHLPLSTFFTGNMMLVIFITSCMSYYGFYLISSMAKNNRLWLFGIYELIPFFVAFFFQ
jgi:undecaprenyl-diphosphatase